MGQSGQSRNNDVEEKQSTSEVELGRGKQIKGDIQQAGLHLFQPGEEVLAMHYWLDEMYYWRQRGTQHHQMEHVFDQVD
jgi:hypothetical protein